MAFATAFQGNAFQANAFQVYVPVVIIDDGHDGKPSSEAWE